MRFAVNGHSAPLSGHLRVPSDKSLSHRAVLFAAMASGTSRLAGVLDSADVRATIDAVASLGAKVEMLPPAEDGLAMRITGWGDAGPRPSSETIDCGNSGTTARLLMGVLAGWPISVTLVGDDSLSARPMLRVTDPLTSMGARFTTCEGRLPVTVEGGTLAPIRYASPVASAQVKSAVLLAGLRASGRTAVSEPAPSRDHTERLLAAFGIAVDRDTATFEASVEGPGRLTAADVVVPADPSSAAFPVVAAMLVPGSSVRLSDVGLNPTRTGFLRVIERMGARITVTPTGAPDSAEPIGEIVAEYTDSLQATTVFAAEVPSLVDEIPILAVLAARASGVTRFEGVGELRVKETDRLEAVRDGLSKLGAEVTVTGDVLEVVGAGSPAEGSSAIFAGAHLDSLGDHRLAMAWAVAGLAASTEVTIDRFEAVDVSYPDFADDMRSLGAW